MEIALVANWFDAEKLEAVKAEMIAAGAPKIHAVWMECYGVWAALEGCHRVRAAHALGLIPEIIEVEYSDELMTQDSGLYGYDGDDDATVSEIADNANRATVLFFED